MIDELAIIPECYVDTNLLESIVPPIKRYNHQKGCPNVAKTMQEKFKDCFALGVIDKDKKRIKYLDEFTVVVDTGRLILYKHNNKPHYIIQIVPAIENFILECAREQSISLSSYGLPDSLKELVSYTKTQTSKNDPRLKKFFKALNSSPSIVLLKEWASYLKNTGHNATSVELAALADHFIK